MREKFKILIKFSSFIYSYIFIPIYNNNINKASVTLNISYDLRSQGTLLHDVKTTIIFQVFLIFSCQFIIQIPGFFFLPYFVITINVWFQEYIITKIAKRHFFHSEVQDIFCL